MKTRTIFILGLALLFCIPTSQAQFGAFKKKVQQKLEKKVEDKIMDELSEAVAERAFRPIDKAMDDWIKASYGADTTETGEIDWEKFNARYDEMLSGMNKAANIPESYEFDLSLEVETKDYSKKKHKAKLHYMKDRGIFGYEQLEDNTTMVVMDSENDLMAMYTQDKNGKKTAQAIPSVMSMASAFGSMAAAEVKNEMGEFTMEKTGKTKKIAGYQCVEWKAEDNIDVVNFYVAEDFPVSWLDAYGDFVKNTMPELYAEITNKSKGMVMYSKSKRKDNNKESTWEVKKVLKNQLTIKNSEWEFKRIGE